MSAIKAFVMIAFSLGIGNVLGWILNLQDVMFLSFIIQWVAFIPSAILQTERFFDLTGSLTYFLLTIYSLVTYQAFSSTRSLINAGCVLVWCVRLGSYLFSRIVKNQGVDTRFNSIKKNFFLFFGVWNLQGLWVFLTALNVFILLSTSTLPKSSSLQWRDFLGWSIWLFGFAIEVVADQQKSNFRSNSENKNKFIDSGLWRYSRHPNYFGEMTLWFGLFVSCSCVYDKWQQWIFGGLSVLFVIFLLRFVSGVPLLETMADKKWGENPDYQRYKANTTLLILWPPSQSK